MTGHCYICKQPSWRTAKINLDYYNIELLNELLDDAQGFPDLNSIIKVADAYRKYSLNLIESIKQYHINKLLSEG